MATEHLSSPRSLDRAPAASGPNQAVAAAVRQGLGGSRRWLPPWLLYDAVGTRLFERITELPEYYLSRAEAEIFLRQGPAIADALAHGAPRIALAEIGAGTAAKTRLLLDAVVARQGRSLYLACDISPSALAIARAELAARLPRVELRTFVGAHEAATTAIEALPDRQALLFIGSSIGNYSDAAARRLLTRMRGALRPGAGLLLGTDLRKDGAVLHAAYDDAQGVTAAFNLNLLTRINRELGADFDLAGFRHVAVWNEAASDVELYLESTRRQRVTIPALELVLDFAAGERIHTESSAKYDDARLDALLEGTGFVRERAFTDEGDLFAVQIARAIPQG